MCVCVCVSEGREFAMSTSVCSGYLYSHQSESQGCCHYRADCYGFVFTFPFIPFTATIWSSSGFDLRAAAVALFNSNKSLVTIQSK